MRRLAKGKEKHYAASHAALGEDSGATGAAVGAEPAAWHGRARAASTNPEDEARQQAESNDVYYGGVA